jgi:hypothetical protein
MTKFILRLLNKNHSSSADAPPRASGDFSSLSWHTSNAVKGVRFALKRISLGQRMELTKRIIDLTVHHEFLKAGDSSDQLEAALSDLLVSKLYLEWGLAQVDGLTIDGQPATAGLLIEKGPEELASEIIAVLKQEAGLNEEERKN